MNLTITPGMLSGTVPAVPSKSAAHRLLICAAFADAPTKLFCHGTCNDIEATASCLRSLGAQIARCGDGYTVVPVRNLPDKAFLSCGESGATLRFLLPVVGALGVESTFLLDGRLPQRPLSPLWEELERMGCRLSRPKENEILCRGKLTPGDFRMDAGVSSQFVSGLLLAMALLPGASALCLEGHAASRPYISMTQDALSLFGVNTWDFSVSNAHALHTPGSLAIEGDWSGASFFLAAQALGNPVCVTDLREDSLQADRAVVRLLPALNSFCTVDASDIPDLVPILAVVAGAKKGAAFHHIARLRMKESDRVRSVCDLICSLGGRAEADHDTLTVYPTGYRGGAVDCSGDHRIAMAAAIAATVCREPVTLFGAECVKKSYPGFWEQYAALGGKL